jgi:hypothetical protein
VPGSPTVYWYFDWWGAGNPRSIRFVHLRNMRREHEHKALCGATISLMLGVSACDLEEENLHRCPNCVHLVREHVLGDGYPSRVPPMPKEESCP